MRKDNEGGKLKASLDQIIDANSGKLRHTSQNVDHLRPASLLVHTTPLRSTERSQAGSNKREIVDASDSINKEKAFKLHDSEHNGEELLVDDELDENDHDALAVRSQSPIRVETTMINKSQSMSMSQ